MTSMTKELAEQLKPLLNTRPMFGVFALGDGSCYFCAACGERAVKPFVGAPLPLVASVAINETITHKPDCGERAHWRAIAALQKAVAEAEG